MCGKIIYIYVLILMLSFVNAKYSLAWDDKVTHKDLSKYAAENSVLSKYNGDFLKYLGFNNGLDEIIIWNGVSHEVFEWIREGAQLEDSSRASEILNNHARFNNHFHKPLRTWSDAGLDDWFVFHYTGESSLWWAQDGTYQQTFDAGDWSWQKVRQVYYWALISTTDALRQVNFAQTFFS